MKIRWLTGILLLCFLFNNTMTFSQSKDSLLKVLKEAKTSRKAEVYLQLSDVVVNDSAELGIFYANKALELAKRFKNEKEIADAYFHLGDAYLNLNDFQNSLQNYIKSLNIRKELKDFKDIAAAYNGIGMVFYLQGEYDKAIKYFTAAWQNDKKANDFENASKRLNNIGIAYKKMGDFDKAIEYYNQALKIDRENNFEANIAIDLNNIGAIHKAWGNYEEALKYYTDALGIDKRIGKPADVAIDMNNIGMVYYSQGKYDKAIEYYMQALEIVKQSGDETQVSNYLTNIGSVYDTWGQFENALEYYTKALELDKKLNNEASVGGDLNNIGSVYFSMKKYREAVRYYEEALEIFTRMKQEGAVAVILNNLASVYKAWKQYEKAIQYYNRVLEIDKKQGRQADIAVDLNNLGLVYYDRNEYASALYYHQQALELAESIKATPIILSSYGYLSDAYFKMGNYKEALNFYKRYTSLKDSIFTEEKHKQIAEFQTKYETEKNKAQIKIQQTELAKKDAENKRQKAIIISAGIVLLLVIGLVIQVYRSLQRKKRDNEIIAREKAKSEELLLNILPLKVVNDLKETGTTEPESFEEVSVYFSDIVGFTDTSSQLEPKFLINELNEIFTAFDDIMEKYQCERIKTIGDAYMAVCGMPVRNANHAENIARAAIDIIHYLTERNKNSKIQWRVRIGINSGKVVGGIVGVKKYIYDVFGDTVNTASRMESNGSPMRINCSHSTYLLLKDKFNFIPREPVEVKGKGILKMYFLDYESEFVKEDLQTV